MPRLQIHACLLIVCLTRYPAAQTANPDEQLRDTVKQQQYDLSADGKEFLLKEARGTSFFLLGELHGENEIPALMHELWPQMWRDGYRHVAAELSPWAANQMEFRSESAQPKLMSLWTKPEVAFVHSMGASKAVLWGCDMEEMQPHLLIRDLATANPANPTLSQMSEMTEAGYTRKMAPELLQLMQKLTGVHDVMVNNTSLLNDIKSTLEIDIDRMAPDSKLSASVRREALMKQLFLQHYDSDSHTGSMGKIMLRFGRNHMHRGYDSRGVSTLGNFVAEFAIAGHVSAFNVAAFGAGGKASLAGETWDADERGDDLAFDFLASSARFSATVFDLRPLRPILHRIPEDNRSALQRRLAYWADSYDAIICYKNVTPLVQ